MTTNGARLETAEAAKTFITAGNARVTLVSQKTGTRYTYRVSAPREETVGDVRFVALLSGPSNEKDYAFLGTIFQKMDGSPFRHGKKSKIRSSAPSARAFAWAWEYIARGEMPPSCEVWHEGRCGKCGRALTVPESIASGIGPVCEEAA